MSCRIEHYFGLWLVNQTWFHRAIAAYQDGLLTPGMLAGAKQTSEPASVGVMAPQMNRDEDGNQIQALERSANIAVLPIMGHMMKENSSFGGCSTVKCRRLMREAVNDPGVDGLMLYIDSPGGAAPGTAELADEVNRARQSKPVRAHVDDMGASAAYWVASQTEKISANKMAEVGSIGTVAVLIDDSAAAEAQGVKVHVISTGEFKGAGAPGAPVTERHLEAFREQVADINDHFLAGVADGRGFEPARLESVSDGRVWIAEKAQGLGLIDAVQSFEESMADFSADLQSRPPRRDRGRALELAEAELEAR